MQESTDTAIFLPCPCPKCTGHSVCLGHGCMRVFPLFFFLIIRHRWDMVRRKNKTKKVKILTKIFSISHTDLLISLLLLVSISHADLLLLLPLTPISPPSLHIVSSSLPHFAVAASSSFSSVSSFLFYNFYLSLNHFLCFVLQLPSVPARD